MQSTIAVWRKTFDNPLIMDELIQHFRSLPKRPFVCQGGIFPWPTLVRGNDGELFRPFVPIWMEAESGLIHTEGMQPPGEDPFRKSLETLKGLIEKYFHIQGCPNRLEVADPELAAHLKQRLEAIGIKVQMKDRLPQLDAVMKDMVKTLGGEPSGPPSLLQLPGVTLEKVEAFAQAAKAFYLAAPWRYLSDTDLIVIESPKPPRGMACLVVLGAGRNTYGIGLYESKATFNRFLQKGIEGDFDATMAKGLTQVTFDSLEELPESDAMLWIEEKLPVAGKKAYPLVMKHHGKDNVARPDKDELSFLEAVLLALSTSTENEIDSGRWEKKVETLNCDVPVALSIPGLIDPPSPKEWMDLGFLPDPRAHERVFADMNRFLSENPLGAVSGLSELNRLFAGRSLDDPLTKPRSESERAQDLCYQAFDSHGRRRVQLAKEALSIDLDCSDAHVILAEQAGTLEEEIDHYRQGMKAAERVLGPECFVENEGHFWSMVETRPYMRAKFGLAHSLVEAGQVDEAVQHYQELLRLNPGDNQGVRYVLLPLLLSAGRDIEAAKLLKEHSEESAVFAYAQALLAFRLSGPSAAADRELREAIRVNPHVPELLLSEEPIPTPPHYSPGSFEEACVATEELRPALQATPDALHWLAAALERREDELAKHRRAKRRKERTKDKKRKRR